MYSTSQPHAPSMTTPTVVKVGLFGSSSRGHNKDLFNLPPPRQLNSLEIWSTSGSDGRINAIHFTYFDDRRQICDPGTWGLNSHGDRKEVDIIQGMYLKELSGFTNDSYVTSLTVVTSTGTKYEFGKLQPAAGEARFCIPVDKGSIVAFFGRSDDYLNAIGTYIAPNMP